MTKTQKELFLQYSDTSANEDNSFRNHIRQPKLLAVSNVNNPVGLVCLPCVMWSAHFFVTHIQTEKIRSWNGPTVHVCCFMLARSSTKTFVSRVRKTAKKIFVNRKIRQQGHSLAEVSLYTLCKPYINHIHCYNWEYFLFQNFSCITMLMKYFLNSNSF